MNKRRFLKALKRIQRLPKYKYFLFYTANKVKHLYLKLSRSTKVAYPSTIMLELTNHCNLACTTCPREYDYGKEMEIGTMKVEYAKAVIDQVWPYLDSIGLTGMGETFLFRQIEEIVDYIKSKNKGIVISVSTNAVVPNFIEKISPLIGKIDTIQVSIDGLNEVYENIRKNASFKTLDDNLETLSDLCRGKGTDLILNMVVTEENYREMPLLVKYSEGKGIKYMDFTLFNLVAVTKINRSYYELYKSPEFLKVLLKLEESVRSSKDVIVTNRNFKTGNGFHKCPFPWTHFYITWNGFVTPCCAKPFPKELNFGNVFDGKLIDILNSYNFRKFRDLWYKNETPDFCNKCHFIDIEPVKGYN